MTAAALGVPLGGGPKVQAAGWCPGRARDPRPGCPGTQDGATPCRYLNSMRPFRRLDKGERPTVRQLSRTETKRVAELQLALKQIDAEIGELRAQRHGAQAELNSLTGES